MPPMPRLMLKACTTVACAGLLFASGVATSSAADECGESYRICNGGCDLALNGKPDLCKIQCDYRLIACNQRPAAASLTQRNGYQFRGRQ